MPELVLTDTIKNHLAKEQVSSCQKAYIAALSAHPFPKIRTDTYSAVLEALKRERCLQIGPYRDITIFEAANRIASDLTLLEGVRQLFQQRIIPTNAKVQLRLGTMQSKNKGDFSVEYGKHKYEGEAFDVNQSFFRSKLGKTIRSWNKKKVILKYIVFNSDCLQDDKCNAYFSGIKQKYKQITFLGVRSWHQ